MLDNILLFDMCIYNDFEDFTTMLFIVLVLQNKTWAFIKLMYCISDKIVSLEKKHTKRNSMGKTNVWNEEKNPPVSNTLKIN